MSYGGNNEDGRAVTCDIRMEIEKSDFGTAEVTSTTSDNLDEVVSQTCQLEYMANRRSGYQH